MNVIVVGSGAREHALCRILHKSYLCEKVFCFPGNYGISQIAECKDISTKEDIIEECIKINPDLVVVGPENYLSENLAGELRNKGLNVFGPDSEGAKLESSKEFMKEFCQSHNIPTAKSQTYVNFDEAKNYLESFNGPIVVKYDGLAAGKGVFVCTNTNEAIEACERIFIKKESFTFLEILFTCISAFATVGFDIGLTAKLNHFGQLILVVGMFVGRLGILLLLSALWQALYKSRIDRQKRIGYPRADLYV